jgi:hypothetical protein
LGGAFSCGSPRGAISGDQDSGEKFIGSSKAGFSETSFLDVKRADQAHSSENSNCTTTKKPQATYRSRLLAGGSNFQPEER